MHHRILAAAAVALLGGALLAGCGGTSNPHPAGSYDRATHYLERGKRGQAVTALEDFLRRSPTDTLADEAQFLKATTYLEMREFPLAAVEFQIFRKDYPMSPRVDDAYYLEGVAMLEQVGRVERDISGAVDAREHFHRFLRMYPESPRVAEARVRLQEISDLAVRKKLRSAEVYRHLGRHQAIVVLMEDTIREESESRLLDQALIVLGDSAREAGLRERARDAYRELLERYPGSGLAPRARSALQRLGEPAMATDGRAGADTATAAGGGGERPAGSPSR